MEKQQQWTLWYFLIAFSILLMAQDWWAARSVTEALPYSEFMRLLKEEKLSDLRIEQQYHHDKGEDQCKRLLHLTGRYAHDRAKLRTIRQQNWCRHPGRRASNRRCCGGPQVFQARAC